MIIRQWKIDVFQEFVPFLGQENQRFLPEFQASMVKITPTRTYRILKHQKGALYPWTLQPTLTGCLP